VVNGAEGVMRSLGPPKCPGHLGSDGGTNSRPFCPAMPPWRLKSSPFCISHADAQSLRVHWADLVNVFWCDADDAIWVSETHLVPAHMNEPYHLPYHSLIRNDRR
jgi:hypothetical protein